MSWTETEPNLPIFVHLLLQRLFPRPFHHVSTFSYVVHSFFRDIHFDRDKESESTANLCDRTELGERGHTAARISRRIYTLVLHAAHGSSAARESHTHTSRRTDTGENIARCDLDCLANIEGDNGYRYDTVATMNHHYAKPSYSIYPSHDGMRFRYRP